MGKGVAALVEALATAVQRGGGSMFKKYRGKLPKWGAAAVRNADDMVSFIKQNPGKAALIALGLADQVSDFADVLLASGLDPDDPELVNVIKALREMQQRAAEAEGRPASERVDKAEANERIDANNKTDVLEAWASIKLVSGIFGLVPSRYEQDYATKVVQARKRLNLFLELEESSLYDLAELYAKARGGM